ncbi:MLO-like protein 11 [Turnera subulata]|uniref:MLO-like protein n=1 Tax=Turnera subulata TaxID=218843 RepID=A0A9Q0FRC9_9ROSI|nr:MLO-like protein 11 [Turnera subulata]
MAEDKKEMRSLALTPTWSVATVLTIFVVVSLIVERSIHRLSNWLRKTNRKPLLAAVEKMKEELMLLGFISLLLTATSNSISNFCIPSKFYDNKFAPCTRSEIAEDTEENSSKEQIYYAAQGYEPFVSYQGLEQLHRFIFVMAVTHISYSCLTMLLAIVKTCFFRQFGRSVVRTDYLTLRKGFIMNHNLSLKYDFHSYMIRSMEEEFQRIVGVSAPLWGFVVAFMLFNVKGSNLYFWIAIIPITLVLLVGAKLQHVIATLALENAGINGYFAGTKLKPRDDLFWFKKPELLLSLIHFILFQWQFGYKSCFIDNHLLVYIRLVLGFAGQFLCSYSTLPLYALVTQMGTNYKAALIPQRIRETIHGWGKAARRKRRHGMFTDDSTTIHTDTSTVMSLEEDDHQLLDIPESDNVQGTVIELQPVSDMSTSPAPVANEASSRVGTPLLRPCASVSTSTSEHHIVDGVPRSSSMPARRE